MAKVTEQWSEERLSKRPPWTGRRVWVVSGVAGAEAALSAIDADDPAIKVAQLNQPWKPGSPLVCTGPQIIERGLAHYKVAADFAIIPGGTIQDNNDDPIAQPPRYRFEQVDEVIPSDRDLDGRPIRNTAGFLLDPMPSTVTFWLLDVWRNEPDFDTAKADAYANHVNSVAMTVAGRPVAVEHMLCKVIAPAGDYVPAASHTLVHYQFQIYFGSALGAHPFQHLVMNAGDSGWYDDSGTKRAAKFSNGKGQPVSDPIRLALNGTPMESVYKVGEADATPVAPPAAVSVYASEASADATFLYYKKFPLADLRDLGL